MTTSKRVRSLEVLKKQGGEACVLGKDGTYSDAGLHDAIMEGVDEAAVLKKLRDELRAQGVSENIIKLYGED